jgi:hypothetical protein
MFETLVAPAFLFKYSAPCLYRDKLWTGSGVELEEKYSLPFFGQLEGKKPYADLRVAWNEEGLAFNLRVEGKKQPPWCRDSRIEDSDGLQVWIDTRNTQNIHRAGRFCHRFALLPIGAGRNLGEPVISLLAINRAKESPREIDTRALRISADKRLGGYTLQAFIGTEALTGYSPADQPTLGFYYALTDRELGPQTFSVGPEFPFDEDPSLWGSLELIR